MLSELRRRLSRAYMIGLGLLLVLYSAAAFGLAREATLWGLDEANRHLAMPVVSALSRPGAGADDAAPAIAALTLAADERLEVLSPDGRHLAGRGGRLAGMPLATGVATWQGAERFRVLTIAVSVAGEQVFVRAAHAATRPHQALGALALVLAGMLPVALLLAWALGDWLAGQAAHPVEAALERERRFMRDTSHELRTPLAALRAQLELLAGEGELSESARERIGRARATARRMGALVDDLLALGREDAGATGLRTRFDLEEVLEEELALLQPLARERELRLEVAPPPPDTTLAGDPDRVARAVRNLLENAMRYAPTGGRVTIAWERAPGALSLSVGNDGTPIPADERDHLFERFYRGREARSQRPDGSGLGLAISRAIARAHGGELALTSALDGPPRFTLTLPTA